MNRRSYTPVKDIDCFLGAFGTTWCHQESRISLVSIPFRVSKILRGKGHRIEPHFSREWSRILSIQSETRWFNTVAFSDPSKMNEDSHKDFKLGDILKTAQKKPFRKTRMDAVARPDGSIGVEKQIDQQVLVFGAHFGYF